MNIKQFKKGSSTNPEIEQLSTRVSENLTQLLPNPMLVGNLITKVAISTSGVSIPHGLPQSFTGWIVVRNRSNILVYETTQKLPEAFLNLTASGSGVIDLWIF